MKYLIAGVSLARTAELECAVEFSSEAIKVYLDAAAYLRLRNSCDQVSLINLDAWMP